MKETKKMMGVIEKQYREANEQFRYEQSKKRLAKDIKDILFGALIGTNIFTFILLVVALYM